MDLLRGRQTIKRLGFLRKSQFWSRDQLESWQLNRLNLLLIHASNESPFYKKRLEGIQLPLTSLEQIEQIPILTKEEIRNNGEDIRCRDVPESRFVASRTGGSTGEPMQYFWDKRGMDWNRGTVYRSAEWAGVQLGEKTAQMSGSHFDYSEMQKLKSKIIFWLQRYRDFPVAFLDRALMDRYVKEIVEYQPTSIWGYAGGIHLLARHILENYPEQQFPFLKAIITSSENLFPEQREVINRAFGGEKVFDNYGSREMYMAAECDQHNGYHIHAEVIYLEVVDKHNRRCAPGELGRVILTDLSNHAFPFIRYEIGDIGRMANDEECACGVRLPRLQSVDGRIADIVVAGDRILTAPNFTLIFSDLDGVDAYQIRQDHEDSIEVFIVPGENFTESVFSYIENSLKELTAGKLKISINRVDQIAVPESGKRRFIISTIGKEKL